jgi:tripartite-type tricarboxylate transporter receptor subunit TctC
MAGINMLHVPYRGTGAAYADLLAGRMQVAFFGPVSAMEHVRSGTLRALAVTGTKRLDNLPNVPAVAEFLPGYEAYSWFGVAAPRGTADEIVVKLNREINAALTDPTIKSRITELGATTLPGSSAEFGKLIVDEIEKWRKVIRAANIKPE